MPEFNWRMHDVTLETLKNASVPERLARSVAEIVACDDATQPNLGRSPEEQELINQAVKILNERRRDE